MVIDFVEAVARSRGWWIRSNRVKDGEVGSWV